MISSYDKTLSQKFFKIECSIDNDKENFNPLKKKC